MLRWGFKPDVMFYFEVHPTAELDGTLEFDSKEGKAISDLLTDYALAFIQEKSHEDERTLGEPLAGAGTAETAEMDEADEEGEGEENDLPVPPRKSPSKNSVPVIKSARAVVKAIEAEEDSDLDDEEDEDDEAEHRGHRHGGSDDEDNDDETGHAPAEEVESDDDHDSHRAKRKHSAAVRIQSTFRGHKGRTEVSQMIEQLLAEGDFEGEED